MKENKYNKKLFKINKNKPLQFKRNLLIEKYIENYLTDQKKVKSTNVSRKSISQAKEEKKTNFFIKKKPISQKKLSLQEIEDSQSTAYISNYITKTNYNNRSITSKHPTKMRTMSCANMPKNIYTNIMLYRKKAGKSFSLRSKSNLNSSCSYIKKQINNSRIKNRNSNINCFREYERALKPHNSNKSFNSTFQMKKNTISKISINNLYKISNPNISEIKHNRFAFNNCFTPSMINTLGGFRSFKALKDMNSIKNVKEIKDIKDIKNTRNIKEIEDIQNIKEKQDINNNIYSKMHKEINIEDFLLIEKKFEQIKNILTNIINKNKNQENDKNEENDLDELFISCNFHIYDLYKFYLYSSIEGSPDNLFSSSKSKNILHEYSIIFIISLVTIYTSNIIKNRNIFFSKINILLNIQQKLFLLLCDAVLKKLNSKYNNNIWVKKLSEELNNKLIFNINDNISQIKLLSQDSYKLINEIIDSIHNYIIINININKNLDKIDRFLYLYNNFYKKELYYFDLYNINEIEELFNKNIFKIDEYQNKNFLNDFHSINNIEYLNEKKYKNINTIPPYLKFPCKKEYTLILDLDETMICFKSSQDQKNVGNIHIRPGLEIFLEIIKEFYEIIIFTVGTREYANIILDLIEKKNNTKFFDGRLYREHATKIGNKFIKDLSKIGRDLSKTLIVDNNPHSFKYQYENGILINSYYGEENDDKSLIELQKILIKIYKEKGDVRNSISKYKEEIIQKVSCSNELNIN